jgi:hypothetical protein
MPRGSSARCGGLQADLRCEGRAQATRSGGGGATEAAQPRAGDKPRRRCCRPASRSGSKIALQAPGANCLEIAATDQSSPGQHPPKPVCFAIAVGRAIACRPPHRSRRALLMHRAPTSVMTSYRQWVCRSFGLGSQRSAIRIHLPPRQPVPLAPSAQAARPVPEHVVIKALRVRKLVGTA